MATPPIVTAQHSCLSEGQSLLDWQYCPSPEAHAGASAHLIPSARLPQHAFPPQSSGPSHPTEKEPVVHDGAQELPPLVLMQHFWPWVTSQVVLPQATLPGVDGELPPQADSSIPRLNATTLGTRSVHMLVLRRSRAASLSFCSSLQVKFDPVARVLAAPDRGQRRRGPPGAGRPNGALLRRDPALALPPIRQLSLCPAKLKDTPPAIG